MLGLFLEWLRNWQLLKKGSAPWVSEWVNEYLSFIRYQKIYFSIRHIWDVFKKLFAELKILRYMPWVDPTPPSFFIRICLPVFTCLVLASRWKYTYNPPADVRCATRLPIRNSCLPVSVQARWGLVNRRQNLVLLVFVRTFWNVTFEYNILRISVSHNISFVKTLDIYTSALKISSWLFLTWELTNLLSGSEVSYPDWSSFLFFSIH
jgi:hypothetical protein